MRVPDQSYRLGDGIEVSVNMHTFFSLDEEEHSGNDEASTPSQEQELTEGNPLAFAPSKSFATTYAKKQRICAGRKQARNRRPQAPPPPPPPPSPLPSIQDKEGGTQFVSPRQNPGGSFDDDIAALWKSRIYNCFSSDWKSSWNRTSNSFHNKTPTTTCKKVDYIPKYSQCDREWSWSEKEEQEKKVKKLLEEMVERNPFEVENSQSLDELCEFESLLGPKILQRVHMSVLYVLHEHEMESKFVLQDEQGNVYSAGEDPVDAVLKATKLHPDFFQQKKLEIGECGLLQK